MVQKSCLLLSICQPSPIQILLFLYLIIFLFDLISKANLIDLSSYTLFLVPQDLLQVIPPCKMLISVFILTKC